jgi:RecA-family ATPase
MDNIEEEEIDWVWRLRLGRGKLNSFEGDPEIGKSYVSLAIAADLSNGRALPFDSEPEAPLKSLIISREDNPADTIKPRLRLLGADMSMIAIPHRDSRPSLDPNLIASVLDEWPAAYIVVDPVIALTGGRNTDKASDVRALLDPLVSIAAKYRSSIVLIRHLNKNDGAKAMYRGQGSIDFTAICRSIFTFAMDPNTLGRRLMIHSKGSLSGKSRTLEFFIDDDGRFRWGAESDETADEALGAGEPKSKREAQQLEAAKTFLHQTLSNGPMPSGKVKERAESAGIANKTLWRAKEELEVKASKERGSMTGEWWWRLP